MTLRHITGDEWQAVNVAIAEMWREIDVATTLHGAELKDHFAELRQGDFQVAQAGWFGENNPEHYLDLLIYDTGDVNYGRFASNTYDTLMRRAHAEVLLAQRLDLLRDAEVVGLAAFPLAPLYSVTIRALVNPRIGLLASITHATSTARDICAGTTTSHPGRPAPSANPRTDAHQRCAGDFGFDRMAH